jgi:hypothetical protein
VAMFYERSNESEGFAYSLVKDDVMMEFLCFSIFFQGYSHDRFGLAILSSSEDLIWIHMEAF